MDGESSAVVPNAVERMARREGVCIHTVHGCQNTV